MHRISNTQSPDSELLTPNWGTDHSQCNAAKQAGKNPLSLISISIGQIAGEHETVVKLRRELGAHFSQLPTGQFSEAFLIELARHCPLRVIERRGEYWCIGGLRVFRLLKVGLAQDTEIPVLLETRIRGAKLNYFIAFELSLVPVIETLNSRDKKVMGRLWQFHKEADVFKNSLRSRGSKALAQMLGCDPRTVVGKSDGV